MTLTIHFAPPFVISVMDVDSVPYDQNATLLRYSELITM